MYSGLRPRRHLDGAALLAVHQVVCDTGETRLDIKIYIIGKSLYEILIHLCTLREKTDTYVYLKFT